MYLSHYMNSKKKYVYLCSETYRLQFFHVTCCNLIPGLYYYLQSKLRYIINIILTKQYFDVFNSQHIIYKMVITY